MDSKYIEGQVCEEGRRMLNDFWAKMAERAFKVQEKYFEVSEMVTKQYMSG